LWNSIVQVSGLVYEGGRCQVPGMITRSRYVLGTALLLLVSACNTDPAQGKPQARVAEPVAASEPPAPAAATRYVFSSDGSKLAFVGAKVTAKHDGSFGEFDGTITLAGNDASRGSVTAEIATASLTVDNPKLTGHLKSADFFDVEKFPKARFTSTAIRPGGAGSATHTVTGNLELHGVTKSISFPATLRAQGDNVDVDAEFAINRKDFGIVYPGMPDDLIKDDVLVKLQIRAKKADRKG
jgi:polyisoprenoid-binding protein YceI